MTLPTAGAPRINVRLDEVGLKVSRNGGVGGGVLSRLIVDGMSRVIVDTLGAGWLRWSSLGTH